MRQPTFLLLGGYGNTGRALARLLLQETDVRLVLAGRNGQKAQDAATELNRLFRGERVGGLSLDASDPLSLRRAFQAIDLVLVASSTAQFAREVAAAALEAQIDYLDLQYSTKKTAWLQSLVPEIQRSEHCFITDGGFHPGLPAAMIRYVAPHFDRLEKAVVGSVIQVDWANLSLADPTLIEFLDELRDYRALVYQGGRWKEARLWGMTGYRSMDFGGVFGRRACVPMFLEEMRSIPELYPSLEETGFFVGGFNGFVDWLILPLAAVALRLWPQRAIQPMRALLHWGLKTFARPPYGTLLRVEARGKKDGQAKEMSLTLSHGDGYLFTAIPVVACLLQYLDGSIKKPGLWLQANLVDPERLLRDMERMGIEVRFGRLARGAP